MVTLLCLLDSLDLLDRLEFPGVDLELSIERHVKQVELRGHQVRDGHVQ